MPPDYAPLLAGSPAPVAALACSSRPDSVLDVRWAAADHAAVESYWTHGGEGGGCKGTDFSNSTGLNGAISGATRPDINGTYSTLAFAAEATRLIAAHNTSRPLYAYLAFEAVHDASGTKTGVQAPLELVQQYSQMVPTDTYKVQTAMLASLDEGVRNITKALQERGMLDEALFIVIADNGQWAHHTHATHAMRR